MIRVLPRVLAAVLLVTGLTVAPTSTAADHTTTYINAYYPSAQSVHSRYGVPASVALAQSILETGWGRSQLNIEAHNFFGIKCSKTYVSPHQTGCYSISTREYYSDTGWTTIIAPFRRYRNSTDSFMDYGLFLTTNSRYAKAFDYVNDYRMFIREVHKAGYATDPDYSTTVIRIIEQYQLNKYDLLGKIPIAYPMKPTAPVPSGPDPLVNSTATKSSYAQLQALVSKPTTGSSRVPRSAAKKPTQLIGKPTQYDVHGAAHHLRLALPAQAPPPPRLRQTRRPLPSTGSVRHVDACR